MAESQLNTTTNSGAQNPVDANGQPTSQASATQPAGQVSAGTPIGNVQPVTGGSLLSGQAGLELTNLQNLPATAQISTPKVIARPVHHFNAWLLGMPLSLIIVAVGLTMFIRASVKTTTE